MVGVKKPALGITVRRAFILVVLLAAAVNTTLLTYLAWRAEEPWRLVELILIWPPALLLARWIRSR